MDTSKQIPVTDIKIGDELWWSGEVLEIQPYSSYTVKEGFEIKTPKGYQVFFADDWVTVRDPEAISRAAEEIIELGSDKEILAAVRFAIDKGWRP